MNSQRIDICPGVAVSVYPTLTDAHELIVRVDTDNSLPRPKGEEPPIQHVYVSVDGLAYIQAGQPE